MKGQSFRFLLFFLWELLCSPSEMLFKMTGDDQLYSPFVKNAKEYELRTGQSHLINPIQL